MSHETPKLFGIVSGVSGGVNVGLRDDFNERCAGTVEINKTVGSFVAKLASILFEMACANILMIHLSDLVAFRKIGVKIVLAVETAVEIDRCIQR